MSLLESLIRTCIAVKIALCSIEFLCGCVARPAVQPREACGGGSQGHQDTGVSLRIGGSFILLSQHCCEPENLQREVHVHVQDMCKKKRQLSMGLLA